MNLPRVFGRRSAALIAELEAQVAHLEEQLNIVQTARIASARDYANAMQAFRNVQLELESDIESAAALMLALTACATAPQPERPRPRPCLAAINAATVTPDAESVTRKECVQ